MLARYNQETRHYKKANTNLIYRGMRKFNKEITFYKKDIDEKLTDIRNTINIF